MRPCNNLDIYVVGNIDGTLSTIDGEATIDIFDVLTLTDVVLEDMNDGCGYEISDIREDGDVNVLDIVAGSNVIVVHYRLIG